MSDRKRFHPIVILSHFIKSIRGFLFATILFLISSELGIFYNMLIIYGIIAICLIIALVKYFTNTYFIEDNKIVMYKGIFLKKETEITFERIQTIKQRQWFFYRPFNVVQIFIETGSTADNEAEASLLAVDGSTIELIEEYRNKAKKNSKKGEEDNNSANNGSEINEDKYSSIESELDLGQNNKNLKAEERVFYTYKLLNKEILFFALTDFKSILILLPFVAFIIDLFTDFSFILDYISESLLLGVENFLEKSTIFVVVILLSMSFLVLLFVTIVKNFLYYFEYTVTYSNETITIEHGLFERKVQKIPLDKVQGVKIYQQLARSILGMSSIEIIIIGGHEKLNDSSTSNNSLIFPLIKTNKVYPVLKELFPKCDIIEPSIIHTGKGKLFYFWRWILIIMIPVTVLFFHVFTWLGVVASLINIITLFFMWLDYRYQGYSILNKNLIVIQNFFGLSKVVTLLNRTKIQ